MWGPLAGSTAPAADHPRGLSATILSADLACQREAPTVAATAATIAVLLTRIMTPGFTIHCLTLGIVHDSLPDTTNDTMRAIRFCRPYITSRANQTQNVLKETHDVELALARPLPIKPA